MSSLTLRVVQGADRGRIYSELRPPITIGREEGNSIQLNDERISRFHIKIQEDNGHLVLTDLESTNGSRVNGQDCQLRILRYGDIIAIGRSVLLFGTREQIASRLSEQDIRPTDSSTHSNFAIPKGDSLDLDLTNELGISFRQYLAHAAPPGPPEGLRPSQLAQLSELLDYIHSRLGSIVTAAKVDTNESTIQIDQLHWQALLQLHCRLSELIRSLGDPDFTVPD